MLQPTNHHRVPYTAGVTATAIARPGTAVGYMTPSGGLMGGIKTSLGCACDQAQLNGTARLRAGRPVFGDYVLHEKGRLLGEREAMGALGDVGSLITAREPTEQEKLLLACSEGENKYHPVMGSDGVLYNNVCAMGVMNPGATVKYTEDQLRTMESGAAPPSPSIGSSLGWLAAAGAALWFFGRKS